MTGLRTIYAAQADAGPVKFGITTNVENRLSSLRGSTFHDVQLLLATPGGWLAERRVHLLASPHLIRHEWYRPAPAVLRLIEGLQARGREFVLAGAELDADEYPTAFSFRRAQVAGRAVEVAA